MRITLLDTFCQGAAFFARARFSHVHEQQRAAPDELASSRPTLPATTISAPSVLAATSRTA